MNRTLIVCHHASDAREYARKHRDEKVFPVTMPDDSIGWDVGVRVLVTPNAHQNRHFTTIMSNLRQSDAQFESLR